MLPNPFKPKTDVAAIDSMIEYVNYVQTICKHEQIPGAVLALAQAIDELGLEKGRRLAQAEVDPVRESA